MTYKKYEIKADINSVQQVACYNAGGRIRVHHFIFVRHWFWQTEFYLTFVLNFNILFINWASVPAGQAMKASTAASPTVSSNFRMTKMNTALIVILAAAVIGALFLFKGKASKNSASTANTADTTTKPHMTDEEAQDVVKRLEDLGYYKYADPKDLDTLRHDLISSLAGYSVLSTVYNEKNFIPLDNRLFLFDGETLFEQVGFMDAIKSMRPLFDKMNFKVDITNHIEEADTHWLNHKVTINGKPYIIFANFEGYGWGEAAQRFAEIINDQLQLQNKDERLYLINGANDGTAIYLTSDQFNLLDKILVDERWKPLPVDKWCKVFEVDPTKYKKNYSQQ